MALHPSMNWLRPLVVWCEIYGLLLVATALGWVGRRPTADAPPPIALGARCLFLTAALMALMAGYAGNLLFWEDVGSSGPIAFQGRYLIPTALPVLLSLDQSLRLRHRVFVPRIVLLGCIVVSQLVLLWTVWNRYYG